MCSCFVINDASVTDWPVCQAETPLISRQCFPVASFTHQTSCGSTSVVLWKWWTSHQGAASVCHTGPLCHTLVDQWYRKREGTACGTVFHCGGSSVLGKCSSNAETLIGSASSSVHTSLSDTGLKWDSQCIPRTSRGSWHRARICGGQQRTTERDEESKLHSVTS